MALLEEIRTLEQCKQFFNHLKDIPVSVGEEYAQTFADDRITEVSLKTLDKQDLKDLHITVLGDV